jgi:hypothetical protein
MDALERRPCRKLRTSERAAFIDKHTCSIIFVFVIKSLNRKYRVLQMKRFILVSCLLSLVSAREACSAGTYYTGAYQSPQYRYGQPVSAQPSAASINQNRWNNSAIPAQRYGQNYTANSAQSAVSAKSDQGFYLNAGISREFANWQFEMTTAGSILHFDNISWNVFDVSAGYNFGIAKLEGGIKYGMQSGDSHMIDDDISNGGYWVAWAGDPYNQDIYGATLSAGTSSGGDMMNFHLGLGLTDKMAIGNMKLTPSIGYRHLSYNLTTEKNSGLTIEFANFCNQYGDEVQCLPIIVDDTDTGEFLEGSYAFTQPGTSHDYDVTWSGPYLALDADYQINQNNAVSARLEFGLPAYESTGDQPYRPDWKHPKSVSDKGSIGDAYYFGVGANWAMALTDSVSLTIGFTYNYYTLSGGDATTYLNPDYYRALADQIVLDDGSYGDNPNDPAFEAAAEDVFGQLRDETGCGDSWACKADGEIDSFYKSMGIRVGIAAKF